MGSYAMKLITKLTPMAAVAMVASIYATPAISADVTASVGVANMYLWRGVNEGGAGGGNAPQVSGELRSKIDNGVYFGTWVSNSGFGGSETDLFLGYSAKAGELTWDVSYWLYLYPESGTPPDKDGLMDTNAAEIVGTIAQGPFSAGLYYNADSDNDDDMYITLGYGWDKYSATYGMWIRDKSTGDEYSHITLSYAATDALSFTLSQAFQDKDRVPQNPGDAAGVVDNPLVQVSYGWNFDLKKK